MSEFVLEFDTDEEINMEFSSNQEMAVGFDSAEVINVGITPDIHVGSTTTGEPGTEAEVTRRPDSPDTDPVLDFTIPRGNPGLGINPGGYAGQVLVKNTSADFDTAWAYAGLDKNFVFTQGVAASTWEVAHNLDKYPAVAVADSAGNVMIGEVIYTSLNTVTLLFAAAFAGKAYFN